MASTPVRLPLPVVLTLSIAVAHAQSPTQVLLTGSVRDVYQRDRYLDGATVRITSDRTGDTITLVTRPGGRFQVPLDPGSYVIAVSRTGYEPLVGSECSALSVVFSAPYWVVLAEEVGVADDEALSL